MSRKETPQEGNTTPPSESEEEINSNQLILLLCELAFRTIEEKNGGKLISNILAEQLYSNRKDEK